LFKLYGHAHKRAPLYRWMISRLIREYFAAGVLGQRVAHAEAMEKANQAASG